MGEVYLAANANLHQAGHVDSTILIYKEYLYALFLLTVLLFWASILGTRFFFFFKRRLDDFF